MAPCPYKRGKGIQQMAPRSTPSFRKTDKILKKLLSENQTHITPWKNTATRV